MLIKYTGAEAQAKLPNVEITNIDGSHKDWARSGDNVAKFSYLCELLQTKVCKSRSPTVYQQWLPSC